MARRPTLYCLLAENASLAALDGDMIDEIRFLRAAAEHFEVYYNNVRYDPEVGVFGDPGGEASPPDRDYDLYYVRDNTGVLLQCGHPRVTLAAPHDPIAFAAANALIVTTGAWKDLLERRNTDPAAGAVLIAGHGEGGAADLPPVFFVGQALDPAFRNPSPRRILAYRHMFTNGQAFGYLGRIAPTTMPVIAMEGIKAAALLHPDVQFVYGGLGCEAVPGTIGLQAPLISYVDMPSALAACAAALGHEDEATGVLGSCGIIDAMVAGTPVLARLNAVRLEQLGEDYPLYYRTSQEAAQRITELVEGGPTYRAELAGIMRDRLKAFEPGTVGRRLFEVWQTLAPA